MGEVNERAKQRLPLIYSGAEVFVNKRGLKLKFINGFINHPFAAIFVWKDEDDATFHFKLMRRLFVLFVAQKASNVQSNSVFNIKVIDFL